VLFRRPLSRPEHLAGSKRQRRRCCWLRLPARALRRRWQYCSLLPGWLAWLAGCLASARLRLPARAAPLLQGDP